MNTRETYDIPQISSTREVQLFAVLPRKKEFIRGGIAAFANIISIVEELAVISRYISYLQGDVSTATYRRQHSCCNQRIVS